ncbi:MAG: ABC transporter permease [Desulfobacca sp.]|uniref:ABC transporter permease n=1 Tax=Desulfobacca sp. TaxID=2067990 RepID=UPI00404A752E
MWQRLRYIIIKEFIQAVRDPRLRIFILLPPIIQLLTYGYAINFDYRQIPIAVWDEANTLQSRELIRRFSQNDYFRLAYLIQSQRELVDLLDRNQVTMALHIPYDFSLNLARGKKAPVQLLLDGTDSNAALITSRYANTILADYSVVLLSQRLNRAGLGHESRSPLSVEDRTWYNPNRISATSFVPGVVAMVVMLVSLQLTALAVVREKEIGTLEQLLVSPIRPLELLLGKTIPFVIISLLDVLLVAIIAVFWFDVPFRGNPLVLLLATLLFLFCTVGGGLLISTVSATQQQAMMISVFIFMPAILLSGLVFPIHNMPWLAQLVTYINPLSYFIVVAQDVFLKGVGLDVLWPEFLAMAVLGLALLTLSVLRFHKRLA